MEVNLLGYSEKDFDFSQNFQLEQEYLMFKERVLQNKVILDLFGNINLVLSFLEDIDSLHVFQRVGTDEKKIRMCKGIINRNIDVFTLIEELEKIEKNFDVFNSNFSKYIPLKLLLVQKNQEIQQYKNIDFQEEKLKQLNEDTELCNLEITRIDNRIVEFQEYRDKIQSITPEDYKINGKESLLKNSKILNEDAKEILYLLIQTLEEYISNSKSWLSNSRSITLEEEYKRQQEVLIDDLNLSLQQLKIDRDEVINNLHEIEIRISDITSANVRLQSEKENLNKEIIQLNEQIDTILCTLKAEFGDLPLLFKMQQKKVLFKSRNDLDSLLNILRDYKDNRGVFIKLFSNEEQIEYYSLLFENRLNKNKSKLFSVKFYLEKAGYITESVKTFVDVEVVPKGSWIYYLESSLYERVLSNENKGQDIEVLIPNRGKWSYFYSDLFYAEEVCKKAISTQICICIKHSDSNEGVCCFYIDGLDIEAHKRVISFCIDNNLLKQMSNGTYYDVSFKFDEQNSHKIMLSHFINLETGKFKEN